jgi:hypothetical protein
MDPADDVYGYFKDGEDTNEWDVEKEKYLTKIADKNGALVWLHNKTASHYTVINKFWSIIGGVSIMLFGAGGITGLTGFDSGGGVVLGFQIATIIAGIVTIIQSIVGLDGMADNHNDAALRNSGVFLDILKELGEKNILLRIRGDRFIHMMVEKDTFVKAQEIRIPAHIVKKYYKKFGKNAVKYDNLFGNDELLKIDESFLLARTHEASLVEIVTNIPDDNNESEESLHEKLKEHDENEGKKFGKFKRKAPPVSSADMAKLELYLNT